MSGKFINKTYTSTIDTLQRGTIDKVKNANYLFNDKPPVISGWYNQSVRGTTFDEGTRSEYSSINANNSPKRYNFISNAVFYSSGIRLSTDVDFNEEGLGLASQPAISGIVLPNTWIPYAGDYFYIENAGKKWLYKVTATSFDTIDNGNNVYSFEAMLDNYGIDNIEQLVVGRYKMVINNIGTEFSAVIKEEDYNLIDMLDGILSRIKTYYVSMFFKDALQTFVYVGKYGNLYDDYMIEFLIRNDILGGTDDYVYVGHATQIPTTFAIDYDKTFFRAVETRSKNRFNNNPAVANVIRDRYSLFFTVMDDYFSIEYNPKILPFGAFSVLDPTLISDVQEGTEREYDNARALNNIIVRYFNETPLDSTIIDILENVEFEPCPYLFYTIPFVIFAIESEIRKLMSSTS